MTWWMVFLPLAVLVVNVTMCLLFHHRGYSLGYNTGREEGYKIGRIDADNWWVDLEQAADQERQKLWKNGTAWKSEWP